MLNQMLQELLSVAVKKAIYTCTMIYSHKSPSVMSNDLSTVSQYRGLERMKLREMTRSEMYRLWKN